MESKQEEEESSPMDLSSTECRGKQEETGFDDEPNSPLVILGRKAVDKSHVEFAVNSKNTFVLLNRLPVFSDFVWERVQRIPDADPESWDETIKEREHFFIIGRNETLKMTILYFAIRDDGEPSPLSIDLKMKDGSLMILDKYQLHLDFGASASWMNSMIPCFAEDEHDNDIASYFYLDE